MVAEKRDPPARPGGRLHRMEKELIQVKRERDLLLDDKKMAEWRNQRWSVNIMVAECRKLQYQRDQLRNALSQAVEWDAYDEEGVEAVWLEDARAALKATED